MSKIEEKLVKVLEETVQEKYGLEPQQGFIMMEIPKDSKNGDYATNAAMRLKKVANKNPREIAEELKEAVLLKCEEVEKVDIAGPGFINFWIKKDSLANIINTVLAEGDNYGHNNVGKGERILMEYVSANPTGPLHLGHARGASWGDSTCRLLSASGFDCLREYYINDAGNQIDNLGKSLEARYHELFGDNSKVLPEDGYHGPDIIEIAKEIKEEDGDKWMNVDEETAFKYFRNEGKNRELARIKKDLSYYGCEFDSWISEQWIRDSGMIEQTLEKMAKMGLTYESDGALWMRTTDYGDDKDRVVRRSNGEYTYFTPDIANHEYKYARGYTTLVNLWGADHHGYIARMQAAMEAMGYKKGSLMVDIIQMVRLVDEGVEVKMSKRTGNAITIHELIDDIGLDSARYFFLARALDTHLDFDIGLARKRTSENPVYYAQYAHARICSVLNKAGEFESPAKYEHLVNEYESELLRHIASFPEVVGDAAVTRAPNKICNYVQKLAQYIHAFYTNSHILNAEDETLKLERLSLAKASAITMKNALYLLGVSAPSKMTRED